MKKYSIQLNPMKSKLIEEFKVIDEAKTILNNSRDQFKIELTNDAVYINHNFYQIIKKQTKKDNLLDFEN